MNNNASYYGSDIRSNNAVHAWHPSYHAPNMSHNPYPHDTFYEDDQVQDEAYFNEFENEEEYIDDYNYEDENDHFYINPK